MGKTNKAQRTKGNTRPSSSVQSALLLNASGKSFVGFDALDKDPCYVPVTGQPDEGGVDSDFRMVMRKMIKRDALTRLKAVQEFGDYCSSKDVDTVKSILPFWPRLFNKLALDCDRRIREATHRANGKLVGKVHRDFAPYLRNVLGVWLLGQCDAHSPSASAARAAFLETFPPDKRSRALLFCKNEIFSYFKDNLCDPSRFLNDVNVTSPEEAQSKQVFVLSSTLLSIKLLFSEVRSEDIDGLREDFEKIVSEAKFWSYLKHKEAQVRCAWYSLMSSLCSLKVEAFLQVAAQRVSSVLIGCLAEKDPVAVAAAWETALHILSHFGVCEQKDFEHSILPQLWSFLREGGRGNANTLYPCLLPMLSRFPREILESPQFQLKFLDTLAKSLLLENVKKSRMECDAILQAFFECFTYFCFSLNSERAALMEKFLLQQVLPMIESSIYDDQYSHFITSKLYSLLGTLLCKVVQVEEFQEAFSSASATFWTELYVITTKFHGRKKMVPPFRQLTLLFRGLFAPFPTNAKRSTQRVRFEKTASEDGAVSSHRVRFEETTSEDEADSSHRIRFEETVSEDEADSKCASEDDSAPHFASEDDSAPHFASEDDSVPKIAPEDEAVSKEAIVSMPSPLVEIDTASRGYLLKTLTFLYGKLCEEFDAFSLKILKELLTLTLSEELFRELSTLAERSDAWEFLERGMLRWLSEARNNANCIVDIIFLVCRCVSEKDGSAVLHGCCEKKDVRFLGKILNRARDCPETEPFRTWLWSMEWMDIVLDVLRETLSSLPDQEIDLCRVEDLQDTVELCLSHPVLREIVGSGEKDEQLLRCIEEGLRDVPEDVFLGRPGAVLFSVCQVVATLLENEEPRRDGGADAVVALLFCLNLELGWKHRREKFLDAAWAVWDVAVASREGTDGLVLKVAHKLHSHLMHHSLREEYLEHQPDVIHKLLDSVTRDTSGTGLDVVDRTLEAILPSSDDWELVREGLFMSMLPCLVANKIFRPLAHEQKVALEEDKIKKMIAISKVGAAVLAGEIERYGKKEPALPRFLLDQLSQLLWSVSFGMGNGFVTEDILAASNWEDLCINCKRVLARLASRDVETLLWIVFDRAFSPSSGWLMTLSAALEICEELRRDIGSPVQEMFIRARELDYDPGKQVMQLLSHHLCFEPKMNLLVDTYSRLKMVHSSYDAKLDLLGELCCILQDSRVLKTELGNDVAKDAFALLPYVDAKDHYVFRSASLLHFMVRQTDGLDEERWRLLERVLGELIEKAMPGDHVGVGDLLDVYRASCLGFVLFEHAGRFSEKSYVPFPRNFRPVIDSSLYEKFGRLFLALSNQDVEYPPLFRPMDRITATLQEALKVIPGERVLRWAEDPTVVGRLVAALSSPFPRIQYGAHLLLMKILPSLRSGEDEEGGGTFPEDLDPLLEWAIFNNDVMTRLLSDFRIGDCCIFLPRTDSYRLAVSFLLTWLEIFEFLSSTRAQLRPGIIGHLSERKLLPALFPNVFRLLPDDPKGCVEEAGGCLSSLFLHGSPDVDGRPSPERLHSLACLLFATALRKMPASIRTWFNNLDKQSADIVEAFTSKYVSGILVAEELRPVDDADAFEGMAVQAWPGSREVVARYSIDDCDIDLCIRLPSNFPLSPVLVDRRGNVAMAEQEWRTWLMQLTTVLNYQDGSILDGLRLWKRNLDKKFEGVEECMICYYILHNASLKLPKLSCHTCKKKFHHACLYKWFRTSNNSSCPLCRNEFII